MAEGFETYRPDGSLAVSLQNPTYQFIKKMSGGGYLRSGNTLRDFRNFHDTSNQVYSDNVLVAFAFPVGSTGGRIFFTKGASNFEPTLSTPAAPSNAKLTMYCDVPCDAYIF